MTLIDTSSWIHLLRKGGEPAARARVEQLLRDGQAAWCPVIRLELWNGAQGDHEKRVLAEFERVLPELPIDALVWREAYALAKKARARGITVPATDVLIAACARFHNLELESSDSDFTLIASV